jgi:hypothetical protein
MLPNPQAYQRERRQSDQNLGETNLKGEILDPLVTS